MKLSEFVKKTIDAMLAAVTENNCLPYNFLIEVFVVPSEDGPFVISPAAMRESYCNKMTFYLDLNAIAHQRDLRS
jgi:hypothetical protein